VIDRRPFDLVVDTSAVMSIVNDEHGRDALARALSESNGPTIAAPTRLELSIVAEAKGGPDGAGDALGPWVRIDRRAPPREWAPLRSSVAARNEVRWMEITPKFRHCPRFFGY
jgi:hypothetical protein